MSKRRKKSGPPFVMMYKRVLESPEWKKLSHVEKLLYIYVKAGYNGGNNGDISFDYSEYARSKENPLGQFAPGTIAKVLGGPKTGKGTLIEKGWLEKKYEGGRWRHKAFFKLTGRFDIIK
jgi:hypothetical protein